MPVERHPTYEFLEPRAGRPVLVSAEHAGVEVPDSMSSLGLDESELRRHIGWDIGVDGLCRELHGILGLPTLLGRYSRLVVDLNRAPDSPSCIRDASDGTAVPGNANLSPEEWKARIERYHEPFHQAYLSLIEALKPKALLSVHSFTPKLRVEGFDRPWHCGVLYGSARGLARLCIRHLESEGGFLVGDNLPYRIGPSSVYTIPVYGDAQKIPMVVIEVRQDLIAEAPGQREWAETLADLIGACFPAEPTGDPGIEASATANLGSGAESPA